MTAPERASLSRDQIARLVGEIRRGERGMHQMPEGLSTEEEARVRRAVAESLAGGELADIGTYSLDALRASTQNCENFMGVAQVPMGLAGPLAVRGSEQEREVFVPLATTEGALIASVNRGCRAITASGGAVVRVEDVGMTRAPAFRTRGIEETQSFLNWLSENEGRIREHSEKTSRFLKLEQILPSCIGSTVFVRFRFTTGDAMGMNMATIACDRLVNELIEPETGVECIALSGNYCVDKKPSSVNWQLGRGKRIWAEAVLPEEVLAKTLKTKNDALGEGAVSKEPSSARSPPARWATTHSSRTYWQPCSLPADKMSHMLSKDRWV